MRAHSSLFQPQFIVDIAFFSGGEQYATETYTIPASTWFAAEQQALQISVNSVYDDARIPDLSRTATVRTV